MRSPGVLQSGRMNAPSVLERHLAQITGYDRLRGLPFRPRQIGEKIVIVDGQARLVKVYESQYDHLRALGLAEDHARQPPAKAAPDANGNEAPLTKSARQRRFVRENITRWGVFASAPNAEASDSLARHGRRQISSRFEDSQPVLAPWLQLFLRSSS